MCGIVGGIFQNGMDKEELLHSMSRSVAHRGPDGQGISIFENLGLGHRRLSIIDIARGAQPMTSRDGRVTISYNGEIFNYPELQTRLRSSGVILNTQSDTEVVLEGFCRFGASWFSALNGQFAIALLDREKRTLTLARDHMGEKPLFMYRNGSSVLFASEVKAIICAMSLMGLPLELEAQNLLHYLSLNYIPFGGTLCKHVRALPPGAFVTLGNTGSTLEHGTIVPQLDEDSPEGSGITSLIRDATHMRLRSDVPVAIFVSGGVDSSLLAWAASQERRSIKAFVADFPFTDFSEVPRAREVCRHLNIDLEVVRIDPEEAHLAELVPALVRHGDSPLADSSSLPLFMLSKEVARSFKVVLTGDGGDELFGGYLTHRATILARALPTRVRRNLHRLRHLERLIPGGSGKVDLRQRLHRFLTSVHMPPALAHFAWNGMFHQHEKLQLLSPRLRMTASSVPDTFEFLASELGLSGETPSLEAILYADQRSYLVDDILAKVDRMTMANGLEARPIFLDPRIVQFARSHARCHPEKEILGKKVLHRAINEELPWFPPNYKKLGFSIPADRWMRSILKNVTADTFASRAAREQDILDMDRVWELWRSHCDGTISRGFELWGILVLLTYLREMGISA